MHLVEDAACKDEDEDKDTSECKKLFKNMKFFLSREIVDRPTQTHKFLSRDYVQPQWVFDCVNTRIILPSDVYLVGRVPPPHLSAFVDNEAEGYVLDYAKTLNQLKAAAKSEVLPLPGVGKENLDDSQNLLAEGVTVRAEAIVAVEKRQKMMPLEKQYHDELKLEIQGRQYPSAIPKVDKQSSDEESEGGEDSDLPDYQQIAEDNATLSMVLVSKNMSQSSDGTCYRMCLKIMNI